MLLAGNTNLKQIKKYNLACALTCKIRIYFIESSLHTVPGPIRPSRRTTAAMKTKNPFDGRPYQLNIGKEVTFLGPRSSF